MSGAAEDRIVARGDWGTIQYARRSTGEMPARDFIELLSTDELRRLAVLFERMAKEGRIWNKKQFRKVDGAIWEFKRGQVRIGCFRVRNTWFLTHGFTKKRDRWRAEEIERAETIRREHVGG